MVDEAMSFDMASNTPYDEMFKTMLYDCRSLIPPVLNEMFNEHYTGDEEIVFRQNEIIVTAPGGEQCRRLKDSFFTVLAAIRRGYIFECETEADGSVLIRLFQYNLETALQEATTKEGMLTVRLPRIALLVLRGAGKRRKAMQIRLILPDDELAAFSVPVMYVSDYTLEQIFEKKLLFLLPFYLFAHEKRFDLYERDAAAMEDLLEDFRTIMRRLAKLQAGGVLDAYTKETIEMMLRKAIQRLTANHKNVQKGLMKVVGGSTLIPHEAWKIRNEAKREGRREGRREGKREGKREGVIATARELLLMGVLTLKQIAQATGLPIPELEAMRDEICPK